MHLRTVQMVTMLSLLPHNMRTVRAWAAGQAGGAHRAILEGLQDLAPQLSVAPVLLDEAALLGREAVGLHLGFLGRPLWGPGAGLAAFWNRVGG